MSLKEIKDRLVAAITNFDGYDAVEIVEGLVMANQDITELIARVEELETAQKKTIEFVENIRSLHLMMSGETAGHCRQVESELQCIEEALKEKP